VSEYKYERVGYAEILTEEELSEEQKKQVIQFFEQQDKEILNCLANTKQIQQD
jgi:succinate dehydrogenase flavin-adding protein (antitoxin of CptAB toxin-antitoxin module)